MAWQEELVAATGTQSALNEEQRRLLLLTGSADGPPILWLWQRALDQLGVGNATQSVLERKAKFVQGTHYPMEYAWLRLGTAALTYSNTIATDGVVGTPFSSGSAATGGKSPYLYIVTSGALPDGLTLGINSGVVSGTPTTPGAFPYTIRVTDSLGSTRTVSGTITIAAAP